MSTKLDRLVAMKYFTFRYKLSNLEFDVNSNLWWPVKVLCCLMLEQNGGSNNRMQIAAMQQHKFYLQWQPAALLQQCKMWCHSLHCSGLRAHTHMHRHTHTSIHMHAHTVCYYYSAAVCIAAVFNRRWCKLQRHCKLWLPHFAPTKCYNLNSCSENKNSYHIEPSTGLNIKMKCHKTIFAIYFIVKMYWTSITFFYML